MHTNFLVNKKRRTNRSVSAVKDDDNRLIYQIITWLQNAIQNEPRFSGGVTKLPTNGSREHVSDANIRITSSNRNDTEEWSVVIYDHLEKLVKTT